MKQCNSMASDVMRLDGFFHALAIVDNGWLSIGAECCNLNNNITSLYQKQFNKIINDGDSINNNVELTLESATKIDNWIDWLQNEIQSFLLSNIKLSKVGGRFKSVTDQNDYLVWQVMEMIRSISNDFESDFIYVSNASIDRSSGKYIFIPAFSKYLVISLMSQKIESVNVN